MVYCILCHNTLTHGTIFAIDASDREMKYNKVCFKQLTNDTAHNVLYLEGLNCENTDPLQIKSNIFKHWEILPLKKKKKII